MSGHDLPVVRYKSKEAAATAELLSIRQDLLLTEQMCERLLDLLRAPSSDPILIEALWSAALVRYSRSFTTGKRQTLDPSLVADLPGDPMSAHVYYKNQRDKFIAHSVNPFEQSVVGLVLSPPDSETRQVIGVADLVLRQISADEHDVRQLGALANEMRKQVELQIDDGKKKVLAAAKRERMDDLYRLEPMELAPPGAEMAGQARK
jgi:hypothetical protein